MHLFNRPQKTSTEKRRRGLRRFVVAAGAAALMLAAPAAAYAEPPQALPHNAGGIEATFQPAYDYDKDGCYPTPAIGRDGTIAPGLTSTSGGLSENCRSESDLANTNGYARSKCNNGWCAIMYVLYFEKDKSINGFDLGGHRHDMEEVVVWVRNGKAEWVSTSLHGAYTKHHHTAIRWEGSHPKIVYHKHGARTHGFRAANGNDEPPENHWGFWQFPTLVDWNRMPGDLRSKLAAANFGSASLKIKDSEFSNKLADAEPGDLSFNPFG